MEQTRATQPSEDLSVAFNIGKAFGLKGSKADLEEYLKDIADLDNKFKTRFSLTLDAFRSQMTSVAEELPRLESGMRAAMKRVLDDQEELMTQMSGMLMNYQVVEDLEKQVKEVYDAGFSRITENWKASAGSADHFEKKVRDFADAFAVLQAGVVALADQYLLEVKNQQALCRALQKGYHYGKALRIARWARTPSPTDAEFQSAPNDPGEPEPKDDHDENPAD